MSKRPLVTLGDDGEISLRLSNGTVRNIQNWNPEQSLVYLVIDCSGSMAGEKLEQAKRGALDFAKKAFDDEYRVGLISFSDNTSHLCSPINDFNDLASAVSKLNVQGGTNMSPAIYEASCRFEENRDAVRAMVIVTDGQTMNPQATIRAAKKAIAKGISIVTIGTDDADYAFLKRIASDVKLSRKVKSDYLEAAISDAVKLLPKGY